MTTGTFLARGVSSLVVRMAKAPPRQMGDAPFTKELPPLSPAIPEIALDKMRIVLYN